MGGRRRGDGGGGGLGSREEGGGVVQEWADFVLLICFNVLSCIGLTYECT